MATNNAVKRWFVAKAQYSPLSYREALDREGLEFFLPTNFVIQTIGRQRCNVERSLIFNFIFVRGTVFEVKSFCRANPGMRLVYRHRYIDEKENTEEKLLITVPDRQMEMFAQTIGNYKSDVPFVSPSEVDLEKGDLVRVLDGPFAGVEGVLMSQQGKDGGRVLVSISNVLAVPTLEIEPRQLQILAFAKSGKHIYKKFDAFMQKARVILRNSLYGKMSASELSVVDTFERRFSALETHTVNSRIKLLVYMLVCYTCMKSETRRDETENKLCKLLPEVNSESFRALALVYLFGCTGNRAYLLDARKITDSWVDLADKEKTKREILEDLNFFEEKFK